MMLYAAIVVATVIACELALRLPLVTSVATMNATAGRALRVVRAPRVSDHWKERILPAYAGRLMKASLLLLASVLAIVLPVVLVVTLATGSLGETGAVLLRPVPLGLMIAVGAGYLALRRRSAPGRAAAGTADPAEAGGSADYSATDKALHRIVLGSPALGEMLFDLDGSFARNPAPARDPVFVTGLARAGTTVLMRALHESGQFASLTYADMPLVLAPNLWARMSRGHQKARTARERAHGDGVVVDFDAPEALEEVFWRQHCGADYIRADGLVPHVPAPEALAAYRLYQARICHRHGKSRYLAKNNNLMLRIGPLAEALPEARFIVPVRDPMAQAASLLAQHRRFAGADAFTRSYMTWLAHHEFGPAQRPFLLPGQPVPGGDPFGLDYWLEVWIACYGWLAQQIAERPKTLLSVIYDRLGDDPAAWARVAVFAGLPSDTANPFRPTRPGRAEPGDPAGADPALVARAREIHRGLVRAAG